MEYQLMAVAGAAVMPLLLLLLIILVGRPSPAPIVQNTTTQQQLVSRQQKQHQQHSAAPTASKQRKKHHVKAKGLSHPFLMGHSDKVLGMDYSEQGKYLVTCGEDEPPPDPGDSNSSGSEAGKENRSPSESPTGSTPGSPCAARKSVRKRRKPKFRELSRSAPSPVPQYPAPLPRYQELNMTENELASMFNFFLLTKQQMVSLGYPVESRDDPSCVVVYAVDFALSASMRKFDVNAREFVPGRRINWSREEDSGQGSGSSSPRSPDSDPDSEEDRIKTSTSVERRCARCSKGFFLGPNGEYLTTERCRHHWGRMQRVIDPEMSPDRSIWKWVCCGGSAKALGCTRAPLHVWSGTSAGLNGPLQGFVKTRPRSPRYPGRNVLALDCEMCYTTAGLQLARLDVIGPDGCSVYGCYVRPDAPIIDYNTRFSGISARHLQKVTKSLKEVQQDLLRIIDEETILVGHALENDLRALRILHDRVVDTSVSFPHERGLPYRKSLKQLALQHLDCSIHEGEHCPLEDARVSLDLMLWKVQSEFTTMVSR